MSETIDEMLQDNYDVGFKAGKEFAQNKMIELMDEVIADYDAGYKRCKQNGIDSPKNSCADELQAKLSAIIFIKDWVLRGGCEDNHGNRVVPWHGHQTYSETHWGSLDKYILEINLVMQKN